MTKNLAHGNNVRIITKNSKEFEGFILPDSDTKKVVLKLNSGYNIGILKSNIKSTKLRTKQKKTKKTMKNVKTSSKKSPVVSIIHTGGTIASEVDYDTGAVVARFTPEELVSMFPELTKLAKIKSKLASNMFSEDMHFFYYNKLAKDIQKEINTGVDGVIVTHGTDTMHYTSAALAFILEDLNVPVLLVGAQRSSDRGSSDAGMNLICAVKFISSTRFADVGICMHETMEDDTCLILPSCRSRKLHSSRRDAFKVIHGKPWARVYYNKDKIEIIDNNFKKKDKKRKLKLKPFKENLKIGFVKAHPNFFAKELQMYDKFNGLILEGYGIAGNFPINKIDKSTTENEKIYFTIKSLTKKMPVIMTSQTIFGRVNQNVYSTGRKLQEAGVLGNLLDITSETAFIKLAWLLSNHPKNVKDLFSENLRGEITKRSDANEDFLFPT